MPLFILHSSEISGISVSSFHRKIVPNLSQQELAIDDRFTLRLSLFLSSFLRFLVQSRWQWFDHRIIIGLEEEGNPERKRVLHTFKRNPERQLTIHCACGWLKFSCDTPGQTGNRHTGNLILDVRPDGESTCTTHPTISPTLKKCRQTDVIVICEYYSLSPMLQTTHPGIGSAFIQTPSSSPSSRGRPWSTVSFTPGRRRNT